QVESSPDAASRWAEVPALQRDGKAELFGPDKIQRPRQAIKASLRRSVVLSVVARVTVEPKRAARILDRGLQVLPSGSTLLRPVTIGIDEVIFLLMALRLGAFHLDCDDVRQTRVLAIFVATLFERDFLCRALADRPNPAAETLAGHFASRDAAARGWF